MDNNVDSEVVMKLSKMLDDNNVHVKSFRMESKRLRHGGVTNLNDQLKRINELHMERMDINMMYVIGIDSVLKVEKGIM
ncbi:hypothetical protein Lal_00032070 [Lupinus albus]|nr:hypothetical protein Lal_00032070 [Lupinus albus]